MASEADRVVHRWIQEDQSRRHPRDETTCREAVRTGMAIYNGFHQAFSTFFEEEHGCGARLIRRNIRRHFGFVQESMVEAVLERILDRRELLLENFRQSSQPSLFAPCAFDGRRFTGFLVRVAHIESLHVPRSLLTRLIGEPPSGPPRPHFLGTSDEEDPDSYQRCLEWLDSFWSEAHRFTTAQRLEGLVSLGLGLLTGHDRLRDRCQELLLERMEDWENERQVIRGWISRLLARREAAQVARLGTTAESERRAAEQELGELDETLNRAAAAVGASSDASLACAPRRLEPCSTGSSNSTAWFGIAASNGKSRSCASASRTPRQELARCAAVPSEVQQLSDDVQRHLAEAPATRRNCPPAWVDEGRQILSRARVQMHELFRRALRPAVRWPLQGCVADIEDLYELGLLAHRGIVGGLGRRHGWRLEWLLRPVSPGGAPQRERGPSA